MNTFTLCYKTRCYRTRQHEQSQSWSSKLDLATKWRMDFFDFCIEEEIVEELCMETLVNVLLDQGKSIINLRYLLLSGRKDEV